MATIPLTNVTPPSNFQGADVPSFPDNAVEVTPSDEDNFGHPVHIYAGGAGTVHCVPWALRNAPVVVQAVVPAGGIVPFRVWRVMEATDASNLLAVF